MVKKPSSQVEPGGHSPRVCVHECDRQTELRSQRPCNAQRRPVKIKPDHAANFRGDWPRELRDYALKKRKHHEQNRRPPVLLYGWLNYSNNVAYLCSVYSLQCVCADKVIRAVRVANDIVLHVPMHEDCDGRLKPPFMRITYTDIRPRNDPLQVLSLLPNFFHSRRVQSVAGLLGYASQYVQFVPLGWQTSRVSRKIVGCVDQLHTL